jgi:hypothetical protein
MAAAAGAGANENDGKGGGNKNRGCDYSGSEREVCYRDVIHVAINWDSLPKWLEDGKHIDYAFGGSTGGPPRVYRVDYAQDDQNVIVQLQLARDQFNDMTRLIWTLPDSSGTPLGEERTAFVHSGKHDGAMFNCKDFVYSVGPMSRETRLASFRLVVLAFYQPEDDLADDCTDSRPSPWRTIGSVCGAGAGVTRLDVGSSDASGLDPWSLRAKFSDADVSAGGVLIPVNRIVLSSSGSMALAAPFTDPRFASARAHRPVVEFATSASAAMEFLRGVYLGPSAWRPRLLAKQPHDARPSLAASSLTAKATLILSAPAIDGLDVSLDTPMASSLCGGSGGGGCDDCGDHGKWLQVADLVEQYGLTCLSSRSLDMVVSCIHAKSYLAINAAARLHGWTAVTKALAKFASEHPAAITSAIVAAATTTTSQPMAGANHHTYASNCRLDRVPAEASDHFAAMASRVAGGVRTRVGRVEEALEMTAQVTRRRGRYTHREFKSPSFAVPWSTLSHDKWEVTLAVLDRKNDYRLAIGFRLWEARDTDLRVALCFNNAAAAGDFVVWSVPGMSHPDRLSGLGANMPNYFRSGDLVTDTEMSMPEPYKNWKKHVECIHKTVNRPPNIYLWLSIATLNPDPPSANKPTISDAHGWLSMAKRGIGVDIRFTSSKRRLTCPPNLDSLPTARSTLRSTADPVANFIPAGQTPSGQTPAAAAAAAAEHPPGSESRARFDGHYTGAHDDHDALAAAERNPPDHSCDAKSNPADLSGTNIYPVKATAVGVDVQLVRGTSQMSAEARSITTTVELSVVGALGAGRESNGDAAALAHSAVLMVRSDGMKRLICPDYASCSAEAIWDRTREIRLNASPEAIRVFVAALYNAADSLEPDLSARTVRTADLVDVCALCEEYQVTALHHSAMLEIEMRLNADSLCEILVLARDSCPSLRRLLDSYVAANPDIVSSMRLCHIPQAPPRPAPSLPAIIRPPTQTITPPSVPETAANPTPPPRLSRAASSLVSGAPISPPDTPAHALPSNCSLASASASASSASVTLSPADVSTIHSSLSARDDDRAVTAAFVGAAAAAAAAAVATTVRDGVSLLVGQKRPVAANAEGDAEKPSSKKPRLEPAST